MKAKRKKCPECKGSGEHKRRRGPTFICHDCDGTGEAQKFEMIFWRYDQFPFVLAARGFIKDNGCASLPSYDGMCVRPIKVLPLTEGKEVADRLHSLEETRSETLKVIEDGFRSKLAQLVPFALKK